AFSAVTIVVALMLDNAMTALGTTAGIRSDLPERITPEWLLGALVLAPIIEELLFRAGMRQAWYALAIGPALVLLMAAPLTRPTFIALAAWVALVVIVNRALAWSVFRAPGRRFAFARRYITHFGWIFWTYTLAFALMHMGNYRADGAARALLPLLVLPQLAIGIVLGFLRLRDGLRSSMLMHLIVNVCATVGMALAG
ncbi:MAG: CPBP family glutamic-type intramembrane protease, partial [Rhizobacter sp.]